MAAGHGHSHVIRDGNIIRATLEGAFNLEGAGQYEKQARREIGSFNGAPFLMLVDNTEVEGGTPEAYSELDRFNQWQNTQALVAKAIIVTQSLLKEILLQRTPNLSMQNSAFFDNEAEALCWLRQQEKDKFEEYKRKSGR